MKWTHWASATGAAFLIAACGAHDSFGPMADEGPNPASENATPPPAVTPENATATPGRATSSEDVGRKKSRVGHSDAVPLSEVDVGWRDQDLGGSIRSSKASIYARIQNNSDAEQSGKLYLVASGLDGQTIKRQLSTFKLGAKATRDVPVAVRRLPIQSQQLAFVVVQAEFDGGDGYLTRVPTPPLHYMFNAQFRQARFYYDKDLMQLSQESQLADAPGSVSHVARIAREDGTLEEVDAAPLRETDGFSQGPTTVQFFRKDDLPVRTATQESQPPAAAMAESESSGVAAISPRICTTWNVFYRDSGRGEDFMSAPDFHQEPARFAYVQLINSAGNTVWEGNLNDSGCTVRSLAPGNYRLIQYTDQMTSGTRTFSTFWNYDGTEDGFVFIPTVTTAFTLTSSTVTITLRPTTNNPAFNAAAVAGQVLLSNLTLGGLGMPDGQYNIMTNLGCPENPPGTDACYHEATDHVRTGTTVIAGRDGAYWKFMIAHELGHYVQDRAMGMPTRELEGDVSSEPLCTCNHYDQTWGNQLHCMQSRETIGGAEVEGFAQAFALRTFNRTNQFDPVMVYYKPFKFSAATNTVFPPLALDGWGAGTGWMREHCPEAWKGVELDWMRFFFRVSSETSSNATKFSDIFSIYRRACAVGGQPRDCIEGIHNISWEHLLVAARAHYGGSVSDPRLVRFTNTGSQTGVNF
jgi:hypothetical protein